PAAASSNPLEHSFTRSSALAKSRRASSATAAVRAASGSVRCCVLAALDDLRRAMACSIVVCRPLAREPPLLIQTGIGTRPCDWLLECWREQSLGSRLGEAKPCATAEQLKISQQESHDVIEKIQRTQKNPAGG